MTFNRVQFVHRSTEYVCEVCRCWYWECTLVGAGVIPICRVCPLSSKLLSGVVSLKVGHKLIRVLKPFKLFQVKYSISRAAFKELISM